ncbi:hypothetical protein K458DRAFT_423808, partial [Lentithecium fluviatile CBS 122367]
MTSPAPSPSTQPSGTQEQNHTPQSGQADTSTALPPEQAKNTKAILWKLYLSHTLSTWNARTFEFSSVIFLAAIFPGTLFYASIYALFRSLAAFLLSSKIGQTVDTRERLWVVRQTILWQRYAVACSCLFLVSLLKMDMEDERVRVVGLFAICVVLACVEKLSFVGNTVAVERDWAVIIADSLHIPREDLNSGMRRIDLVCKLVAPLCISVVDGYSTKVAIWVVFGQNAFSVVFEYFAIAQVYKAIPELAQHQPSQPEASPSHSTTTSSPYEPPSSIPAFLRPWMDYARNPAFLASFSLALLYLTVLSFASQMTTYLLTLGFTSVHVSIMRLVAVLFELSATCAAPLLMRRIGAVRSGLWFVNEQLISVALALGLFSLVDSQTKFAAAALVIGVTLSRLGLWGFDLCVQYLVQGEAPEATRGSFSAVEASLQNLFELLSFGTTMVFARPAQFKYPVYISAGAIAVSAACFAGFVRQKRGHLLHGSKCFGRMAKGMYEILPTIEEEETELEELPGLLSGEAR